MGRWIAVVLISVLLAACSGGSSSVLPKPSTAPVAKARVNVSITMRVPGAASAHSPKLRRIYTVAQNTAGAQVKVFAAGNDNGTPLATTAANIEPSTSTGSTCSASDTYGNRSCSFSISAPLGNDDFIISTYDQAPVSGTIPAGANQLGWGIDPAVTITAGEAASVSATLSSVLASVSLDLTPSVVHQIIPTTGTVGVYALDADNDVIVSNGFVDPNGNPITLTFAMDNNLNGTLYFPVGSISAPSPNGVQYIYAPQNGVLGTAGNVTVNFSVSCSANCTTTGAALQAIYPSFTSISDPALNTNNTHHGGIVFYPPSDVCYTVPSNNGGISCYTGSGSVSSYLATATAPILGSIVTVAGGQFVAIAGNQEQLFNLTPMVVAGPNSTLMPVPNGGAIGYDPNTEFLWYTSGTSLISYPFTSGPPTTYSLGPNVGAGVTVDGSSNVWIVDNVNDQLFELPNSAGTVNSPTPLQPGGQPWDVLANGNGIFVTDHGPNPAIVQLNTSGTSIVNTIAVPGGAIPWYMMPDNAQPGIVWFDFMLNGQIGIGRMDTNTSPATFVMASDVNGSFGSQAGAIGATANGLVYMVFDGTSTLVQVTR